MARAHGVIQQSVFEGIFVKALRPTGAFRDELKEAGYDLDHQLPSYPTPVFKRCLEIACRHEYPALAEEEAMRKIGARFLDGFFETIVGKMVAAMLPMLGPTVLMKRLPRFFSMGSAGTEVLVQELGDKHWSLELRDPDVLTDFDAGIVSAGLERVGVHPTVTVVTRKPDGFTARVTW